MRGFDVVFVVVFLIFFVAVSLQGVLKKCFYWEAPPQFSTP